MEDIKNNLFNDFDSIYEFKKYASDERLHEPRDFENDFLIKSFSKTILRNDKLLEFIKIIQSILYKHIRAIDYLKIYKNYTVNKNYKKIK